MRFSKYFWVIRDNLFALIIGMVALLLFCAIVDVIDHLPAYFPLR